MPKQRAPAMAASTLDPPSRSTPSLSVVQCSWSDSTPFIVTCNAAMMRSRNAISSDVRVIQHTKPAFRWICRTRAMVTPTAMTMAAAYTSTGVSGLQHSSSTSWSLEKLWSNISGLPEGISFNWMGSVRAEKAFCKGLLSLWLRSTKWNDLIWPYNTWGHVKEAFCFSSLTDQQQLKSCF